MKHFINILPVKTIGALLLLLIILDSSAHGKELSLDAFVDLYHSYDFNRPITRDRPYNTQAVRHDEFNANLVSLGVSHRKNKINSRLALQTGTSVQANYAEEPNVGQFSGATLSRHIQEGFIEYHLSDNTALIGGIFFSHIGNENFVSIHNWAYTRSLAADYSPYYQAGVGIKHDIEGVWQFEGYVLNGWQNISEDDSNKALGFAARYKKGSFQANYSNYLGPYQGNSRHFHDVNFAYNLFDNLQVSFLFDQGWHEMDDQTVIFYTYNIQARYHVTPRGYLNLRFEQYYDPYEVNVVTNTGRGFQVTGYSLNFDLELEENYFWRIEARQFRSKEDIFTYKDRLKDTNTVLVNSISAKF